MTNSGVDSNKIVRQILTDSSGRQYVLLSDGTNIANFRVDSLSGKSALIVSSAESKNTFSAEYGANQAGVDIITPAAGCLLSINGVVSHADTNTGNIELDFAGSGIVVWRHYVGQSRADLAANFHIEGAVDEPLTLTTTTGANDIFIIINFREEA
ncbi:MAG: hypothetical protein KAJ10_05250 [Thermodesulfovibrionia bacterium]|nr:hypothetical protein [Thermodesulfovibrionia bacterium]